MRDRPIFDSEWAGGDGREVEGVREVGEGEGGEVVEVV